MRSCVPIRLRSALRSGTRLTVLIALVASVLGMGALVSGPATAATSTKTFNCAGYDGISTSISVNGAPAAMYVNESSNAAKGSLLMRFTPAAELGMSFFKKEFTIPEGETLGGTTHDVEVRWLEVGGGSVPGSFGGKPTSLAFRFPKEEMTRSWDFWKAKYVSDGWTWTSTPVDVPLTAPATPGRYPVSFGNFGVPLTQSGTLKILGIPVRDEVPLGGEVWDCTGPAGGFAFPEITVRSRSYVTVAVDPGVVQQGAAATARAAVRVDGGQATGRVEFFEVGSPGVLLGSTNVVNGDVPPVTLSTLPAGEQEIGARFVPSDPSLYDGSTAVEAALLTVRPPSATATTLTVNPLNILTTQSTTATAEVTSASGTPTGSVVFTVDGVDRPAMALSNGKVSLELAGLDKGSHPISARYVPANTDHYEPSASLQRTVEVTKLADPSSTSITVTPNPAYTTDTVTARATVNVLGELPAQGTVEWTVVGTDPGNAVFEQPQAPIGAGGQAPLDLSHLPAGEYEISADFAPATGSDQSPSSAAPVTLAVKRPPATTTSTSLAVSKSSAWTGESVTATATVSPSSPAPQGDVVFTVDGVDQDPVPLVDRTATHTLDELTAGVHEVSARFVPEDAAIFTASQSVPRTILVQDKPPVVTTTTIGVDPGTITEDESATATATVTAVEGTPSGDVVFTVRHTDGTTRELTRAFRAGGVPLVLDGLAPDTYTISARFVPAAGSGLAPSSSGSATLVVGKAPAVASTTTLALSRRTAETTDVVTATASVATGRGVGVGKVRFTHGATQQLVDLDDGSATITLANLAVGDHEVVATFVPADATRQLASTSAPRTVTVTQAPDSATVTTLGLSRSSVPTNSTVVATAQVASVSGTPAGQVVFEVDGSEVARRDLLDGAAQATIGSLAVGTRSVMARYLPAAGSKQTASTSAPQSLTVVPAPGPAPTVTVLGLTSTVVGLGEETVATARVSSAGTPVDGSVEFTFDGSTSTVALNSSDEASTTLSSSTSGAFPVRARFVPSSGEIAGSQSPEVVLTVNDPQVAATTTTLDLSTVRAPVGQTVRATARVHTSASVATGSVRFVAGGQLLSTSPVDPETGTAAAVLTGLAVGQHLVVAEFVPADPGALGASASAATALEIHPFGSVNLTLSAGTIQQGATLSATAAVSASGTSPSGVVTFEVGGTSTSAPVVDGSATATLPELAPGTYDVVAELAPTDPRMPAVTSEKRQVVVTARATGPSVPSSTAAASNLRLSSQNATVAYGAGPSLTIAVADGAAGVVQLTVAGHSMDAVVTDGRATATLPRTLAVGAHTVSASFVPADPSRFAPSSATTSLTVVKDRTKVRFGQRYFTAERVYQVRGRVGGVNGSLGSGRVTFTLKLGSRKVGRVVVDVDCNGYASASFPVSKPGVYKLVLAYSGSESLEPFRATKTKKMGGNR